MKHRHFALQHSGRVQVVYNLGTEPHTVTDTVSPAVNDGRKHVVRLERREANATLTVDYKVVAEYVPKGKCSYCAIPDYQCVCIEGLNQLKTLNQLARIIVGATIDEDSLERLPRKRIERSNLESLLQRPFVGEIAGVVVNDVPMFDMAAKVRHS